MKKNLYLLIVGLFGLSIAFYSCKNYNKACKENDEKCAMVNVDSLLDITNKAWENKNTEAIKNTLAEKAVVLTNEGKIDGRDSIMAKMVKFDPDVTAKLECVPAYKCVCCCCASYSGQYTMTMAGKDKTTTEKGTFTFIWRQQKDDSWKLVLMHMAVSK